MVLSVWLRKNGPSQIDVQHERDNVEKTRKEFILLVGSLKKTFNGILTFYVTERWWGRAIYTSRVLSLNKN